MSLPSRGRGLKSLLAHRIRQFHPSLPSRGRGLKFQFAKEEVKRELSLPSRGRGLKFTAVMRGEVTEPVAPFTGAWIEIVSESSVCDS